MALPLLIARRAVGSLQQTKSFSTTSSVFGAYWNKDWRPADEPPTTEEGKRAAAKKYGLIREDYETYTPDGTGYGDYPKLPLISAESRDPHGLYDHPEFKRNFGEPMHVHFDMVGEDRWHYNQRYRYSLTRQLLTFLTCMGTCALLMWGGEYIKVVPVPMMRKSMPNDGKTHYTFELEDVE